MIKTKNLKNVVDLIEWRSKHKKDFVVNTKNLESWVDDTNKIYFTYQNGGSIPGDIVPNDIAHEHLATKLKIPREYYNRLQTENPHVLRQNLNHGLRMEQGKNRLLRLLPYNNLEEGKYTLRGYLSNRFKIMDHNISLNMLLEEIHENRLEIHTVNLTDKFFHLQLLFTDEEQKIVGQPWKFGIAIRDSEVGFANKEIYAFSYNLVCTNGMYNKVQIGRKQKFIHRGSSLDIGLLSDKTINLQTEVINQEWRDIIRYYCKKEWVKQLSDKIKIASNSEKIENIEKAVDVTMKDYSIRQEYRDQLLRNLIDGGERNQFGMFQAITSLANDKESDIGVNFQQIGGKILDLSEARWREYATI